MSFDQIDFYGKNGLPTHHFEREVAVPFGSIVFKSQGSFPCTQEILHSFCASPRQGIKNIKVLFGK